MARYRKVDTRIWNDEKFRQFSDDGKLAFLFVLTHPNLTSLGAMRATIAGLASEIGWKERKFRSSIAAAQKRGMAEFDEAASLVWLPNFLRYNAPESPNVVRSWEGALDLLPECDLKRRLVVRVLEYVESLGEGFREALPEAFRKGMPNPEQEQEQEQEPEPEREKSAREAEFETWWKSYPKKAAKDDAQKSWVKRMKELPPLPELLAKLAEQAASNQWTVNGGEFIPNGSTYLNQGRWKDDVSTYPKKAANGNGNGTHTRGTFHAPGTLKPAGQVVRPVLPVKESA